METYTFYELDKEGQERAKLEILSGDYPGQVWGDEIAEHHEEYLKSVGFINPVVTYDEDNRVPASFTSKSLDAGKFVREIFTENTEVSSENIVSTFTAEIKNWIENYTAVLQGEFDSEYAKFTNLDNMKEWSDLLESEYDERGNLVY